MAEDRAGAVAAVGRDAEPADGTATGPVGPTPEISDPDKAAPDQPLTGIPALMARFFALRPVRVFFHYLSKTGPLMASGLAFQATFAAFAGLWVGFSIIGIVLSQDAELRNSLIDTIAAAVPGLIDPGDGSGAVNPDDLLDAGIFGWTGAFALVGLLATALNFLASSRDAVRHIFGVQPLVENIILRKLKDLGLGVGFGAALLVSAVLSSASTALLGSALDLLGIGSDSQVATALGTVVGLALVLALDTVVLAGLYRILSGIPIPRRRLLAGALLGAVGLGVLMVVANTLLGGAGNNPLLASFAILVGLLIYFNLACQVILICASWIAVGMEDAGIAADPVAAEAARAERERIAELERLAREAREPRGLGRLFRRRKKTDS